MAHFSDDEIKKLRHDSDIITNALADVLEKYAADPNIYNGSLISGLQNFYGRALIGILQHMLSEAEHPDVVAARYIDALFRQICANISAGIGAKIEFDFKVKTKATQH